MPLNRKDGVSAISPNAKVAERIVQYCGDAKWNSCTIFSINPVVIGLGITPIERAWIVVGIRAVGMQNLQGAR
jgi:hypothetical protein